MNKKVILILGASSDIAKALAHKFAKKGYCLYLAGKDMPSLEADANDIKIRYVVDVRAVYFDALDFSSHADFYAALPDKPFGVVVVFGYLGDHSRAKTDFAEAKKIIDTNYSGAVSILNIAANDMQQKKEGFIVGVSSVAGDRGRASNYIYGSAKAAFTAYLSGLRHRLFADNVQVLTVKPGFVSTKMTESMALPPLLTASPTEVATDILQALHSGKNTVYTKWFWKYIMLIIIHLPELIFKRSRL